MLSRCDIPPIETTIPDERQKLARYYGVHPYFTRRSANVVQTYLRRYSLPGDAVADPFGGSGVTALEALLMGRKGIQNDLNPLANFITRAIGDTTLESTSPLKTAFQRIEVACRDRLMALEAAGDAEVEEVLSGVRLPSNDPVPGNSDAKFFHDLFTRKQLAALGILKSSIDAIRDRVVREALLLAWSAAAGKMNKTFISAKGRAASRGGSSIFSIYRYKLAKNVVELPLWETFRGRFLNVLAAKEEVLAARDHFNSHLPDGANTVDSRANLVILQRDAAELDDELGDESVDYIFTDPPYGGHIAYLDLSVLWNHWMGLDVSEKARRAEAIVGGACKLTEEHYKRRLAGSIVACTRLLRPDRWMSVVFQHWDVSYFEAILNAATGNGLELRAAVTQEREVIWSMHKKKHSEGVLGGEMILTFYKPAQARRAEAVCQTETRVFADLLETVLRQEAACCELTSQYLFNKLILHAWQANSLSELRVTREAFAEALRQRGWSYDAQRHLWRRGARERELALGFEDA